MRPCHYVDYKRMLRCLMCLMCRGVSCVASTGISSPGPSSYQVYRAQVVYLQVPLFVRLGIRAPVHRGSKWPAPKVIK